MPSRFAAVSQLPISPDLSRYVLEIEHERRRRAAAQTMQAAQRLRLWKQFLRRLQNSYNSVSIMGNTIGDTIIDNMTVAQAANVFERILAVPKTHATLDGWGRLPFDDRFDASIFDPESGEQDNLVRRSNRPSVILQKCKELLLMISQQSHFHDPENEEEKFVEIMFNYDVGVVNISVGAAATFLLWSGTPP